MSFRFSHCVIVCVLFLSGCSQIPDQPNYQPSTSLPEYQQRHYSNYVQDTRQWVSDNRVFLTPDKNTELTANTPFEVKPELPVTPSRGVLLVHGLGDSPGYFQDVATTLAKQGFLVRSMLLPGHGSKPADLMLPDFSDWEKAVQHQIKLLEKNVDEVWLGGFSTGGNLVTTEALNNDHIAGLLLFSPGFEPKFKATALAPYAKWFKDWADIEVETNYMRYDSLSMNGAALYYQSSKAVRDELSRKTWSKPALITISENDSVISPEGILSLFNTRFTHPNSRLIWYGNRLNVNDSRLIVMNQQLPEERVSNFAHMSVLFSPSHPYYGKAGSYRMCNNGQTPENEEKCSTASNIWYSAWGYQEAGKNHARLTWNPYYPELEKTMKDMLN